MGIVAGHAGSGVEHVAEGLASEGFGAVEFGDGNGETWPDFLVLVKS